MKWEIKAQRENMKAVEGYTRNCVPCFPEAVALPWPRRNMGALFVFFGSEAISLAFFGRFMVFYCRVVPWLSSSSARNTGTSRSSESCPYIVSLDTIVLCLLRETRAVEEPGALGTKRKSLKKMRNILIGYRITRNERGREGDGDKRHEMNHDKNAT